MENKANKEFSSIVLDILSSNSEKTFYRGELRDLTGFTDRELRKEIENISYHRVVVAHSGKAGYRLAKDLDKLSREEIEEEIEEVERVERELCHRIIALNKKLKVIDRYINRAYDKIDDLLRE